MSRFMIPAAIVLAASAYGQANAPALMMKGDGSISGAWGVESRMCEDGESRRMFSTLPLGEMGTGILSSPAFEAPAALSFFVAGHSHQKRNEVRLVDAATGQTLRTTPVTGSGEALRRSWDLAGVAGRQVRVELVDGDTGTGWAWLCVGGFSPDVVPLPEGGGLPNGWEERPYEAGTVVVDGVPYKQYMAWPGGEEGKETTLSVPSVLADHMYLLGGSYTPDTAGPGWGGSNDRINYFLGDRVGTLSVVYASGESDDVPMVFGYTLWWRGPYGFAHAPFSTDLEARRLTDAALCVAHGLEGHAPPHTPYYLRIALRDEPVVALRLKDAAEKDGHPVVDGITFAGVRGAGPEAEDVCEKTACEPLPEQTAEWLKTHTIDTTDPWPPSRQIAVTALNHRFSTFASDVTHAMVAAAPLDVDVSALPGPRVAFTGPPEATILARTYYDCVQEMLKRTMDDGMIHESDEHAPNFGGFGGWQPDMGPFYDNAYTRNRTAALYTMLGDVDRANAVNDFFDRWIMYFPKAFPELKMGGKPVPGHSTVIANQPHVYWDSLRLGGWPSRFDSRDYGNPETDGHGFNMLGHWRAWNKVGRDPAWVRERWEALRETAEYVPWCLENPELSLAEHGLLYSESEGGMTMQSLYANVAVYYGLLSYADMAEAIGETALAKRWRTSAGGMVEATNTYSVKQDPEWGDVWDPAKTAGWGYEQGVLGPIIFAADRYGWDITGDLPEGWLKRTERSYEMIQKNLRPDWCAPGGFGYGQCYYAQTALLLDRMEEAEPLLHWLARLCFAPRLPHPYRVPEGAVVKEDGSEWRRWGDLGNLYQMNEGQYTVHVVMGIDDLDENQLVIMPRVPASWKGMDVRHYPVRTRSEGTPRMVNVDVRLSREQGHLSALLQADNIVDAWRVRMGPFPKETRKVRVQHHGRTEDLPTVIAGDSTWVWIQGGRETTPQTVDVWYEGL